ncbi:MAG: DUF5655 domain-containing protein [Anaerosomatales bacterium]
MSRGEPITLDEYFAECEPGSRELFEAVRAAVDSAGPAEVRATRSQVAFRRRTAFAWAWVPGQYLRGSDLPPLVLSVGLRRRDASPRWKEVVEPAPGRFMHHLEVRSADDLDYEVLEWLAEAWDQAG